MGQEPYRDSEQLWSGKLRRPTALFGIVMERSALAKRISERVEQMLDQGAIGEVELALERQASKTARKAIGFKEIEAVLADEIDRDQAAERIERRQRQYVRRQTTWMRKLAGVELIDRTSLSAREAAMSILDRLSTTVGSG
jgi:tRNA dimethylallyltransferase